MMPGVSRVVFSRAVHGVGIEQSRCDGGWKIEPVPLKKSRSVAMTTKVPLDLIAEQHDLILIVVDEIHELLAKGAMNAVGSRSRLFAQIHLLGDFLLEHFFLERTTFLPPVRQIVRAKGNQKILRGLQRIERRMIEMQKTVKRFLAGYTNPQRREPYSSREIEDLVLFIDQVESMISAEDRQVIPLVERLTGHKSARLRKTS